MLLRQLRYFAAVVETGSFTEAAERCHISQSAMSQQVQALERELRVKLLHRKNRSFTLTAAGEHLYRKGCPLLDQLEHLCRETTELGETAPPSLQTGCLRGYSGPEFQLAVAEFTQAHPEVLVEIFNGSHEDLYDALRLGRVDVVLNDQRRAFSDAYVNQILTTGACCVELSSRSQLAAREGLTAQELRELPCILAVAPDQRDNEKTYYRDIMGLESEFLFADDLEQARLLVVGGKGYLPVEGVPQAHPVSVPLHRIPLLRNGMPILRNYCVFWKVDNKNPYIEDFARTLQKQFTS
ncbi:MAG: LysR family transcriptional regulator [Oscillospiraceae bacterium]|nr:LysR family transcriptional regulator [Oscillospiraceae bacterium]